MARVYYKKIPLDDYLTKMNKDGEVCPRLPKDWRNTEKYGKDYLNVFMNAVCVKLNSYEGQFKSPTIMANEVLRLKSEVARLTKENKILSMQIPPPEK